MNVTLKSYGKESHEAGEATSYDGLEVLASGWSETSFVP